jgi:hypothetical protein
MMRTLNSWRRPFAQLRQQFQELAANGHGLKVEFGDYLDEHAWIQRWESSLRELVPGAPPEALPPKPMVGGRSLAGGHFTVANYTVSFSKSCIDPGSDRFGGFRLCGERTEVEAFRRLSETAGACLPIELRPKTPIPIALVDVSGNGRCELLQDVHDTYGIWLSFIFHTLYEHGPSSFSTEVVWHSGASLPNWPQDRPKETGAIIAYLTINPIQAAILAIDTIRDGRVPPLTLLDRFPALPVGHVEFLEFVRDEVHHAVEAKRSQLDRGYSNATLESMVRGVKWYEASQRLENLSKDFQRLRASLPQESLERVDARSELPAAIDQLATVLQWPLSVGVLEQIDELLQPAVKTVRMAFMNTYNAQMIAKVAVVNTAGDLWKALAEGYKPARTYSAISIRPGANVPEINGHGTADQEKWATLDRIMAMLTVAGGDKATAVERFIAQIALARNVNRDKIINMALEEFLPAARAFLDGGKSLRSEEVQQQVHDDPATWLTVTEAARISAANRGVISRAAAEGKLKSNGKKGNDRRIAAVDLTRWTLERSIKPEVRESEGAVRRKLAAAGDEE